jgi:membrane associated rhomboid family serine protease
MGIYDRSYYREERPNWLSGRSLVANLIIANVAVFVAQAVFGQDFTVAIGLRSDVFAEPWYLWEVITYGFAHDDIQHILFNTIGLWVFGSELEGIYGRSEFLRIYLVAIVLSGLAWVGFEAYSHGAGLLIGASGGVMAVMILWVLRFPRRLVYIWGVIPLPGWALGALFVLIDVAGISSHDTVAHVAHLAGGAFALVYYQSGWNLGRMLPGRWSGPTFRWRPRLRIHDPHDEGPTLGEQVDRILEKISREGEASLTKSERRTLEEASRRYQQRRQ